jgi:hypothetical protein
VKMKGKGKEKVEKRKDASVQTWMKNLS